MTDDLDLDEIQLLADCFGDVHISGAKLKALLARARRCAELEAEVERIGDPAFDAARARAEVERLERERDEARDLYRETEERFGREVSENMDLRADFLRLSKIALIPTAHDSWLNEARRRWAGEKK